MKKCTIEKLCLFYGTSFQINQNTRKNIHIFCLSYLIKNELSFKENDYLSYVRTLHKKELLDIVNSNKLCMELWSNVVDIAFIQYETN